MDAPITLPWAFAINAMKFQLVNQLKVKYDMCTSEALAYVERHAKKFNTELHELMEEIINERTDIKKESV